MCVVLILVGANGPRLAWEPLDLIKPRHTTQAEIWYFRIWVSLTSVRQTWINCVYTGTATTDTD